MTSTLDKIDFAHIAANEDRAAVFREECYRRVLDEGPRPLLSRASSNTKTRKSMRVEYCIVALSLAHATESGSNVCPQSTAACRAHCVGSDSVGLAMVWRQIMEGRIAKTQYLMRDRAGFIRQLVGELHRETRIAEREGSKVVCRLNTFSDIPWEHRQYGCIPQCFPDVVFYDYTKLHNRVMTAPVNYHLCGSWSENPRHQEQCWELLLQGKNIAVAFGLDAPGYTSHRALLQPIPRTFRILATDFQVYPGDDTDLRFLDAGPDERGYGRVCGLAFKSGTNAGREAGLRSGFVVLNGKGN